jgi:hypothetical protein
MLHAIENPTTKVAAVAAIAGLTAMLALASAREETSVRRLVLIAPEQPHAIYLTAWHQGDVFVEVPNGEPRALTFEVRALVSDGCEWLATERLVPAGRSESARLHLGPTGGDVYSYSYEETILACEPGATPAIKTPRTGIVVAHHVR